MSDQLSLNTFNGKSYALPTTLDDKKNIEKFLQINKNKKVIVVQGLGFVGAVMSIVCANSDNEDYAVIGIDLPTKESYWKICSINEGIFPVISADKKIDEYFHNTTINKNFYATYDSYAYSKADIIIVDINLDVQKELDHIQSDKIVNFSVDLNGFKNAIKSIGKKCKNDALILIETTVPPGATKLAKDIIDECLKERSLKTDQIKIGHSYERVMPGPNYINSIKNFYRVYSGVNKYSADCIEEFLKTIISIEEYPLTRLKNTNSTEMAKVLENSFRAMNISFIVEWSRFAEDAGVDLFEVVNAIRMRPTHKNIMLPGLGVGGYCLTKDPLLASWSMKEIIKGKDSMKMSEMAVSTNDNMPFYAFNIFKSFFETKPLNDINVHMLGVSYAPDVGDTRYSPVELLSKLLIESKCKLTFHDPFIAFWNELNTTVNKTFIDLKEPQDAIIFSTGHSYYKNNSELIRIIMDLESLLIFDTVGVLSEDEITELSSKHTVKVLGRGDL